MTDNTRHSHLLADTDKILDFITSGKAIFTVKNRETGNRATYRVEAQDDGSYIVSVFTGSDNSKKGSYTLLGVMSTDGNWKARTALDEFEDLLAAARVAGDTWLIGFVESVRARDYLTPRQQRALLKNLKRHKVAGHITDKVKLAIFPWTWNRLVENKGLPDVIEVWHEGCCAQCARRLSVPASIELGYGPDCAATRGLSEKWSELDRLLGNDLEAYAKSLAA